MKNRFTKSSGMPVVAALAVLSLMLSTIVAAPPEKPASIFAPKQASPAKPQAPKAPDAKTQRVAAPAADGTTSPDERVYTMRLSVTPKAGQTLEAAYFDYLSKNRVHPKVLRAKVRQIANAKRKPKERYAEVVAIIRSALRTGQVQPWMYEALGLAMKVTGTPRDEVERTFMSAADFATTPTQIIYLADYLDRMDFDARALQLLRNVSDQAPGNSEVYVRGLELAKSLKDDDGIMWASIGILRQAWPYDQRAVRERARRAALVTLARIRKHGDKQTADKYAKEIKVALVRDVVVRVAWAGEADVDIMVEEPSGSVCSFRNPRTSSGGVLVGDTNTKLDRSAGEGYSEIYVCPEAFAGTYRVLLRQVWGRIPAGKVTIDVWKDGGTDHAERIHKVLAISDEKPAMVVFDLEKGRRQESLQQHQIANDVRNQLAINRGVLAQQISAISNIPGNDPVNFAAAQQVSNQQQQPFVTNFTPVRDRLGRVGFRPEITIIPIGATMSVTAVISADRRYVRITALPFFSGVTAVTQYNLGSGVTGIDVDLAGIDVGIGLDRDLDTDLDAGVDAA